MDDLPVPDLDERQHGGIQHAVGQAVHGVGEVEHLLHVGVDGHPFPAGGLVDAGEEGVGLEAGELGLKGAEPAECVRDKLKRPASVLAAELDGAVGAEGAEGDLAHAACVGFHGRLLDGFGHGFG